MFDSWVRHIFFHLLSVTAGEKIPLEGVVRMPDRLDMVSACTKQKQSKLSVRVSASCDFWPRHTKEKASTGFSCHQ